MTANSKTWKASMALNWTETTEKLLVAHPDQPRVRKWIGRHPSDSRFEVLIVATEADDAEAKQKDCAVWVISPAAEHESYTDLDHYKAAHDEMWQAVKAMLVQFRDGHYRVASAYLTRESLVPAQGLTKTTAAARRAAEVAFTELLSEPR